MSRLRRATAFMSATVVFLVTGCTAQLATHVEVDVFSGRPNPEFDLNEADSEAVIAAFSDIPWAGQSQTPPSNLGFRGLVLTGDTIPWYVTEDNYIQSIRVLPEGYYIESTWLGFRFVNDPEPYGELLPIVEDYLEDSLYTLLPPPEAE
ncbi:MAG: hypothetical protein JW722_02765 [Demequinaceae bacterium]|nr:hypothetical protein [Demequinaceae bacterium]